MRALILAAGKGRNLSSLTETRPKAMLRMCGKPFLQYTIENLKEIGITDITIVIGHEREIVTDYFGRGDNLGLRIEYVVQQEQNGIGNVAPAALGRNRFQGCRRHQGNHGHGPGSQLPARTKEGRDYGGKK